MEGTMKKTACNILALKQFGLISCMLLAFVGCAGKSPMKELASSLSAGQSMWSDER